MTFKMCLSDSEKLAWWEVQQGWVDRAGWLRRGWGNRGLPHLAKSDFCWLRHASEISRHLDFTFISCTSLKIPATGWCWKLVLGGNFHQSWWHLKQSIKSNCILNSFLFMRCKIMADIYLYLQFFSLESPCQNAVKKGQSCFASA